MAFDIDPVYVIYLLAAAGAVLIAEAVYVLLHSTTSYRDSVNRRLKILDGDSDRERILVQLRKERGLTASGDYSLSLEGINRLILQSGITIGIGPLIAAIAAFALILTVTVTVLRGNPMEGAAAGAVLGLGIPYLALRFKRARRLSAFANQFPDSIDIVVRSLRAGHPVPVAIAMVAREMPDPVGSEFGIAADEITYGSDLETAMRNLAFRVGQADLPLFVTAVAIQSSTGGNLREILDNLSSIIRLRIKMRRKVSSLSAEGRFSALILSGLPLVLFGALQVVAPDFYGGVWHESAVRTTLALTAVWMFAGNIVMYKMVNFKI